MVAIAVTFVVAFSVTFADAAGTFADTVTFATSYSSRSSYFSVAVASASTCIILATDSTFSRHS
jgi:hypothetical protein